jgi:D-amino peptidase
MRVVLSADMEGITGIARLRECLAASSEYWETGRPTMTAEVAAAAEGLLAAGATEVVVLDNHGSGNPANVDATGLPPGARLETWNVFDLPQREVDAMLQVGYHARGGVEGFLSHTYVPGLRLRVDEELISESHGRVWAAGVPLLGIVGNDLHEQTLGSLAGTPFLVVQRSRGHGGVEAVYPEAEDSVSAIRSFAEQALRQIAEAPRPAPPQRISFHASLPNAAQVEATMTEAGWTRAAELEYSVDLAAWPDARGPLAAAMAAGIAPYLEWWRDGITSPAVRASEDQDALRRLVDSLERWERASEPDWWV